MQTNGTTFNVVVNATDSLWNKVAATDSVWVTCSDPLALLPAPGSLVNGTRTFQITLHTSGQHALAAQDQTQGSILSGTNAVTSFASAGSLRGGSVVAIHDSALTRALATSNAAPTTPSGSGTTGKEWWPTNWNYFVMPESLKEALRSDGTPFEVISDNDIAAGRLMDTNGRPRYPIVFSLASEAIHDAAIVPLTNYVAAGGFLFVGSSSFTRRPDGTTRGDFAFASELGIHMAAPALTNWVRNSQLSTLSSQHRLVSHIPPGLLYWEMPEAANKAFWGTYPHTHPYPQSLVWNVESSNATVLAEGNFNPLLLERAYGGGRFIYYAPMQPLIGHGGWSPGMYAYLIFRNAIDWAFEAARQTVVRVSPWPYAYDAAFMVRHDLENYQDAIANIENFARFERDQGAKGNYYFVTGTLREDMAASYDTNAVVASLRRAVTNYGATIGPHNGGLRNPYNNPPLARKDYDYWHWGPDEALDVTPSGYSSGLEYASISVSNSFRDVETWLAGLVTTNRRSWVSPYFNSTREASLNLLSQLGVKAAGEVKLTFLPHWTLSTATSGKRYSMVSLPVSDWFVGNAIAQSLESNHTQDSLQAGIDFYYQQGGLINFYGHLLNTNGIQGEYVRYAMNTNLHPRLWAVNALDLYDWWLARSNAQVLPSHYVTNGNESVTTFAITGVAHAQIAIDVRLPASGTVSNLLVYTNGTLASTASYRRDGLKLKLLAGQTTTNAQVRFRLGPQATPDTFVFSSGPVMTIRRARHPQQ